MGGFWPSAASALANWGATARGRVNRWTTGVKSGAMVDSATVWQAWQTEQEPQCVSAVCDVPPEAWLAQSVTAWAAAAAS